MLELALREATRLGHAYIGTEHILLGLIREGEGVAAQVLVRLGADPNRVRQQVIQLLHGYQGKEPQTGQAESRVSLLGRSERHLLAQLLERISAIDTRLSAVDAQDYEKAASLRDREKELLADKGARQDQWVAAHPDLPSLAGKYSQLSDEVDRLRKLTRQQGIEPDDTTA